MYGYPVCVVQLHDCVGMLLYRSACSTLNVTMENVVQPHTLIRAAGDIYQLSKDGWGVWECGRVQGAGRLLPRSIQFWKKPPWGPTRTQWVCADTQHQCNRRSAGCYWTHVRTASRCAPSDRRPRWEAAPAEPSSHRTRAERVRHVALESLVDL